MGAELAPGFELRALEPRAIWAIRVRVQIANKKRDLALSNLSLDRKLRGFDLLRSQVSDDRTCGDIRSRTKTSQRKTGYLRAVPLLLRQTEIDSKARNLGVKVEDALELAEIIDP